MQNTGYGTGEGGTTKFEFSVSAQKKTVFRETYSLTVSFSCSSVLLHPFTAFRSLLFFSSSPTLPLHLAELFQLGLLFSEDPSFLRVSCFRGVLDVSFRGVQSASRKGGG